MDWACKRNQASRTDQATLSGLALSEVEGTKGGRYLSHDTHRMRSRQPAVGIASSLRCHLQLNSFKVSETVLQV